MKTIQTKSGEIVRVKDLVADDEVKFNKASFVPKKLWKTEVRDFGKSSEADVSKPKPTKRKKEGQ